jgi:hypothetical protein
MLFLRLVTFCVISLVFSSCSDSSRSSNKQLTFGYDLHLSSIEGSANAAIICFHGLGGDYRVAHTVAPFFKGKASVISFNFPDYGKRAGLLDQGETYFGTIDEILPALYVLKQTIIDKGFHRVCLYGFSAGGAALVNCLSALSNSTYDLNLRSIGIREAEKKKILKVIQQGDVILDTPLKSIDELVALYGMTKELELIGTRYQKNEMDPIESIKKWKNLSLNILVHFQVPDEVVSNRDDDLFLQVIKKYNQGTTNVLVGSDTGHCLPHPSLWEYYLKNNSF